LEAASIRKHGQKHFDERTKAGKERSGVAAKEREAKEQRRLAKEKKDAAERARMAPILAARAAYEAKEREKAAAAAARLKKRTDERLGLYASGKLQLEDLTSDELTNELRNKYSITELRELEPGLSSVASGNKEAKMKRLRKAEAAKRKAERASQLAAKRKAEAEPAAAEPAAAVQQSQKKPRLASPAADGKLPSPAAVAPAASPAATPAASPAADAKADTKKDEHAEEEAEAEAEDGEEEYVVEKVVREGWVGRPNRSKRQYLVKWKGYPHSENTWEPAEHLKDNAAFVAFRAAQ
jgi:uncharacterized phage infection (PIP) family protein YhgE